MLKLGLFSALSMAFLLSNQALSVPTDAHCVDVTHTDGSTENICEKGGKDYLILEFFSPLCGACQRNVVPFREFETLASEYAAFRLVSLLPIAQTQTFIDRFAITNKVALGGGLNAALNYGVTHVPTIVVVNKDNKIIFHEAGVLSNNKAQRILDLIKH